MPPLKCYLIGLADLPADTKVHNLATLMIDYIPIIYNALLGRLASLLVKSFFYISDGKEDDG